MSSSLQRCCPGPCGPNMPPCSEICRNWRGDENKPIRIGNNFSSPYENPMCLYDDQGWTVPFTQSPTFKGPIFINVESSRRDKSKYPYSNSFALKMTRALKGVRSIEVVDFSAPTLEPGDGPVSAYFYLANGLQNGYTTNDQVPGPFTTAPQPLNDAQTPTELTLDSADAQTPPFYVGATITFLSGAAAGETRTISAHTSTTIIEIASPFTSNPSALDTYTITYQALGTPGTLTYGDPVTVGTFQPQNVVRMYRTMEPEGSGTIDIGCSAFAKYPYDSDKSVQYHQRNNVRRVQYFQPELETLGELQFTLLDRLGVPLPMHKLVLNNQGENIIPGEDEWTCTLMVTARNN